MVMIAFYWNDLCSVCITTHTHTRSHITPNMCADLGWNMSIERAFSNHERNALNYTLCHTATSTERVKDTRARATQQTVCCIPNRAARYTYILWLLLYSCINAAPSTHSIAYTNTIVHNACHCLQKWRKVFTLIFSYVFSFACSLVAVDFRLLLYDFGRNVVVSCRCLAHNHFFISTCAFAIVATILYSSC